MNTETPIQKISAAQARALLPELEQSGLPLAEFARQRNVDRAPLYNARRAARMAASTTNHRKFARVTVLDSRGEPAPALSSAAIVVELPNHIRVQIPSGVDEVSLRRVLKVAGSC